MTDWTAQEIQAQLERIVASREFADSQRLGQFLEFVVGQALEGRQDRITQYEIAVEGLGYGRDFDPATNPSVRIMARRLRRERGRARTLYGIAHNAGEPFPKPADPQPAACTCEVPSGI